MVSQFAENLSNTNTPDTLLIFYVITMDNIYSMFFKSAGNSVEGKPTIYKFSLKQLNCNLQLFYCIHLWPIRVSLSYEKERLPKYSSFAYLYLSASKYILYSQACKDPPCPFRQLVKLVNNVPFFHIFPEKIQGFNLLFKSRVCFLSNCTRGLRYTGRTMKTMVSKSVFW